MLFCHSEPKPIKICQRISKKLFQVGVNEHDISKLIITNLIGYWYKGNEISHNLIGANLLNPKFFIITRSACIMHIKFEILTWKRRLHYAVQSSVGDPDVASGDTNYRTLF